MTKVNWLQKAKMWARSIKRDVVALWLAAMDARMPWYSKLTAGCVAAYALSPIDLIPDFIPTSTTSCACRSESCSRCE